MKRGEKPHTALVNAMSTEMKSIQDDPKATQPADENDNQSWSLTANSGWKRFSCSASGILDNQLDIVCAIGISGDFWDRGVALDIASLKEDFHSVFPQVILSREYLSALCKKLDAWLELPEEFSCDLSEPTRSYQEIIFSLGRRPEFISSIDKPVFELQVIISPTVVSKYAFIVDQSCIRICRDELRRFTNAL